MNSLAGSVVGQGQPVEETGVEAPASDPLADGERHPSREEPSGAIFSSQGVSRAVVESRTEEQVHLLNDGVSRHPGGLPDAEGWDENPVRVDTGDAVAHYDGLPLVTLNFEDLTMDVVTPGDGCVKRALKGLFKRPIKEPTRKRILSLEGVKSSFQPGDCVALMGSSGAGKTTLLNVLSGRVTKNVGGRVQYNGLELPPEALKAISCFVQQEVIFFGTLTVQEHLEYQAALRLPPSLSARDRAATVNAMIEKVGLSKVADSLIGNVSQQQLVGISGGEQRRLSVATELLTEPCVIFADEPTSGLDSYMAMQVVKLFKGLALDGRTVVCTIHQPSSSVFAQFNKVVLMSEGHLLYCGDREACIGWFAHLGQVCEADMNPAEFLIKVTAVTDDNREAAVQRTVEWAERWRQEGAMFLEQWEACAKEAPGENGAGPGGSGALVETKQPGEVVSHAVLVDQSAQTSEADRPETQNAEPTLLHRKLSSRAQYMLKGGAMSKACLEEMKTDRIGVLRETWLQIQRSTLLRGRDPFSTYVRLVTTVISALIPALMYYRLTWQSSDAWNKVSSSFYIILSESMACLFGASMAFNKERAVIQREYESGVTRMPLYFIGRITADSLLWMFFPFIYHLIVYWISDLGGDSVSKYFASLAITLLLIQVVLSYTYVVVALIKHPVASTVVLQIMQMILTLFSGFMVKLDELGKFWIWIVYLSPFKYALPCFTVTIFWNTEISSPSGSTVSGVDFLNDTFGFQHDKFWLYVGLLFVLGISGRLLGMVALSWKASRTKENQ